MHQAEAHRVGISSPGLNFIMEYVFSFYLSLPLFQHLVHQAKANRAGGVSPGGARYQVSAGAARADPQPGAPPTVRPRQTEKGEVPAVSFISLE